MTAEQTTPSGVAAMTTMPTRPDEAADANLRERLGEFRRSGALLGVQPGVRHRDTGLLRDDLDQESLLGGWLPLAGRDQVA